MLVGQIIERLQARYWNFVRLEPVLWEREPLRATAHFNEELIKPSDCDLVIGILWARLGSPLPSQFNRADGTRFESGTEWELVEAVEAFEQRCELEGIEKAKPDILIYRRTSPRAPVTDPGEDSNAMAQQQALESFFERFFFYPDGTIRRSFSPYQSLGDFAELLEGHLEKLILRRIELSKGLVSDAEIRPIPIEGSPFKGLSHFN